VFAGISGRLYKICTHIGPTISRSSRPASRHRFRDSPPVRIGPGSANFQSFSISIVHRAYACRVVRLSELPGTVPPVLAFWSVTAFDKEYFIANPINRYAIGDRDALRFNPDGSLDLYIQNQDPGPDRQSNWLPSGDGPFNLTLRLYWPKPRVVDSNWQAPAVERLR